jgi:hypothetical protein
MRFLIAVAALATVLALPSVAFGLGEDLKVSDHGTSCVIVSVTGGSAVNCAGKYSGLGSTTTDIRVNAGFFCTNRGGNDPPGQVSGQQAGITPQNGQVTFDVTSAPAKCHDGMTPTFGPATVSIFQNGTMVAAFTYSLS